jgi:glycosyltransferase involved in cell wall biosynthesis
VETLKHAIESVLRQDYPNVELIVVDAASTDGTIDLLESYGDRLTWTSRQDRGAFDAINDGWKMSKGEILAWVNSDDIWDKGAAAFAAQYFRDHPDIDVLYGACGAINEQGQLIDEYPPRPWDLRFALENCDHIINQTASFMRREIIEKVGYLYPAWCHDHDLWLRIAVAGGSFGTTPRRLGSARIWEDNLGNNPKVIVPGKVGLTRRFFETPNLPRSVRRLKRRAISNSYLRCMFYVSPKQPKNWLIGLQLMLKAVITDPPNVFYLTNQVTTLLARRTPLPAMWHACTNLVGGLARRLARAALLPFRLVGSGIAAAVHALKLPVVWRLLSPAASVGAAAAVAFASGLATDEAAQVFALVALPLLAMCAVYELSWNRDRGG